MLVPGGARRRVVEQCMIDWPCANAILDSAAGTIGHRQSVVREMIAKPTPKI